MGRGLGTGGDTGRGLGTGGVRDLLADAGVAGEDVGVLQDGQARGRVGRDLEDAAPLGEVGPVLLVLGATLHQAVQPLGTRGDIRDGAIPKVASREEMWPGPPSGTRPSLTLGRGLAVGASQGHDPFVHLGDGDGVTRATVPSPCVPSVSPQCPQCPPPRDNALSIPTSPPQGPHVPNKTLLM